MKITPLPSTDGAFTVESNRRLVGGGMTLILAEPQDVDEMWRQLGRGARGAAVLDLFTEDGTEANIYLAKRMLSEHLRAGVQVLADGTVRIPCRDAKEAALRKGKIEQFVRTNESGYKMPDLIVHLLDESQWAAADLCRGAGSGYSSTGLPMAAINIPEGDSLVCVPEMQDGRVVGYRMVLQSVYLKPAAAAPAEEPCLPEGASAV